MNVNQINDKINRMEKEMGLPAAESSKVFSGLRHAVQAIATALPRMKAAGVPARTAASEAPGMFRSIVRKQWGDTGVDYRTERGIGRVEIVSTFRDLADDVAKWTEAELS